MDTIGHDAGCRDGCTRPRSEGDAAAITACTAPATDGNGNVGTVLLVCLARGQPLTLLTSLSSSGCGGKKRSQLGVEVDTAKLCATPPVPPPPPTDCNFTPVAMTPEVAMELPAAALTTTLPP
ncbi:hypothetical protein V6L77_07815 [Pannonibacter sp. Pt2-lr]